MSNEKMATSEEGNIDTSSLRVRRFCFTYNNYPKDWYERLRDSKLVKFFMGGEEKAPSTGTPHIQGYLEIPKKKTLKALQKKLCKADLKISLN